MQSILYIGLCNFMPCQPVCITMYLARKAAVKLTYKFINWILFYGTAFRLACLLIVLYLFKCVCVRVCLHMHICMYVYIHTLVHTYIHLCAHECTVFLYAKAYA